MKNLFYPLFLISFFTLFTACKSDAPKPEIQIVEPYKMKSGKMVNRFENAILNMEREDSLRTPHENEILFIGSSSIRLWKNLLVDMLPLNVINRGFGGSTIPEVNYYVNRIVLPYKPPLIVFYCGENDITDGFTPQEVKASFVEFDNMVHLYLPKTQVVFISMKPSLARWELWDQFKEGNQLIKSYIETRPHICIILIAEKVCSPQREYPILPFLSKMGYT